MLISPQLQYFTAFGFNIYYYGIFLAFSILVGFILADKIAKKYYNIHSLLDQSIILICLGLIGARLYYCIINYQTYFETPSRILYLREGGLSIHGAIIGGIFALYILSRKYNYKFIQLCDIFAVTLPLSQSIGRWGNFFNSEAFGLPTTNFLKLYVSPSFRPIGYENFNYFHPTFLYESIFNILLFIIIYNYALNKHYKSDGFISGFYLVGYGIIRLIVEPLRLDCTTFIFNIPVPMFMSLVLIIIGLYLIKQSLSSK